MTFTVAYEFFHNPLYQSRGLSGAEAVAGEARRRFDATDATAAINSGKVKDVSLHQGKQHGETYLEQLSDGATPLVRHDFSFTTTLRIILTRMEAFG